MSSILVREVSSTKSYGISSPAVLYDIYNQLWSCFVTKELPQEFTMSVFQKCSFQISAPSFRFTDLKKSYPAQYEVFKLKKVLKRSMLWQNKVFSEPWKAPHRKLKTRLNMRWWQDHIFIGEIILRVCLSQAKLVHHTLNLYPLWEYDNCLGILQVEFQVSGEYPIWGRLLYLGISKISQKSKQFTCCCMEF